MKKIILLFSLLFHINSAAAGELILVDLTQLRNNIYKTPGDKVLFLFASWCGPCKETIPTIDAKNVIFISIDKDTNAIKEFAGHMKYNVYHLNPTDDNLLGLKDSLNIEFAKRNEEGDLSWGIPYFAFLDNNSKVLKTSFAKEDLYKYLR